MNFELPQVGVYNYVPRARVRWGQAGLEAVREEVGDTARFFILTTPSLVNKTPIIDKLQSGLSTQCCGLFHNISEHTPFSDVVNAAQAVRAANADIILSVGGGSIIDAAKAVIICLRENIDTVEALSARIGQISEGPGGPRHISIPTTLSGAEHTEFAGGINPATGTKELLGGTHICPHTVILDPAISLYTPEDLWLSTAIRSVDHAVEGICAPDSSPLIQAEALGALGLFAKSLRRTKQAPDDLTARLESMHAVWLATASIGRVMHGASHGLGYLLGALGGVPHGVTSCVFLPAVLDWNLSVNADKQKQIAAALGAENMSAGDAVRRLVADLGLPGTLSAVGADDALKQQISEYAMAHPVVMANPRAITSPQDIFEIMELAA
jgi:alcohol dehydrogenase class IV